MEDNEHPQNKEYSFMQEVIKDEEADSRIRGGKIIRMAVYGAVFGVAASIVFGVLSPWTNQRLKESEEVEIPKDSEDGEAEETGAAAGKDTDAEDGKDADAEDGKDADAEDGKDADAEDGKDGQDAKDKKGGQTVKDGQTKEDSYRQAVQSLGATAVNARRSLAVISKATGTAGQEKPVGAGISGLVLADNGAEILILSHKVNIGKGESIQAAFSDGKRYAATVKMQDENLGICIYAVARAGIEKTTWSGIHKATLGNSYTVENGEPVIVVGKPFGSDEAYGYGAVTAEEEYVEKADGRYRLLCTNIAGNGEGSGVILNARGDVVGIIDSTVLGEGSSGRIGGYAISGIKDVIELLSNGSAIPYTGIYGMDVTEELMEKGMPQGLYVREVAPDSPAMAAGIQSGDVIVSIDGEDIVSFDNYHSMLMQRKEGDAIGLHGLRQGAGDEYVDMDFSMIVGTRK